MLTFKCPLSIVVDNGVVSLLEELDGGEALDLDLLHLVQGRVHLGNHNVLVVLNIRNLKTACNDI